MLGNYFKTAFRNLWRHKAFSLINIIGLAIGMACFILISQWVMDELSYDRHHKNADRICRVIWDIDGFQLPATPGPFANWLLEYIPEIEQATRLNHSELMLQYKETKIKVAERFIETSFFNIFSMPFLQGDSTTALDKNEFIVLTAETARKLFGDEDPIGKMIHGENGNDPKIVTGVIDNIPRLTDPYLKADCFVPFDLMRYWRDPDSWEDAQDFKTYVLLHPNSSADDATEKINSEFKKFVETNDPENAKNFSMRFFLQPITKVHLYSDFKFDFSHGRVQYVVFFSLIAIFILIIACFNFMNLATARSLDRAREVGVRKVVGANRLQLVCQFLGESIIISTIALLFAMVMVELLLPYFNNFTGKPLSIAYSSSSIVGGLSALLLITGLISGSYPAIFLSFFNPVIALKNKKSVSFPNRSMSLRRLLVVIQFALSIMIIAATLVVYNQLNYIKNKNLGFDKENLIYLKTESSIENYDSIKSDLLNHANITHVTASSDLPTNIGRNTGAEWEGRENDADYISFPTLFVSDDFLETFHLEMAQGRFFSSKTPNDQNQGFIVNEAAIRAMHLQDPIGKSFKSWDKEGQIIGVIKDFHFKSLRSQIEPIMFVLDNNFRFLFVKVTSNNIQESIEQVKNIYRQHHPDQLFEIHFFVKAVDELYHSDQRMGILFICFSSLAIVISCLGLFGLVSFINESKTKEIGIRKVVGASRLNLLNMLTQGLFKWILLANLFAWPIAWFAMNKWLQNFAYRIDLTIWPFLLAGLTALAIALLTVSWQTWRAARRNPVEALRYE